jgi:hypothetical protein
MEHQGLGTGWPGSIPAASTIKSMTYLPSEGQHSATFRWVPLGYGNREAASPSATGGE